MALQAEALAASIAGLTVTGVNIRGLSTIPESLDDRDCPCVFPRPDGFFGNLSVEVNSFGSTAAKKTARYDLTYTYAHSQIGKGRGLFDLYSDMVAKCTAFLDVVIGNDALSPVIDLEIVGVADFGPVTDPSGKGFHGATIILGVTEFIN